MRLIRSNYGPKGRCMKNDEKHHLAVDVVLLLPPVITDLAIRYNQMLKQSDKKIILNKIDYLPHISLDMGVVDSEDISHIKNNLQLIADQLLPMSLTIGGMYKNTTCGFSIENSSGLQELQEQVIRTMTPFHKLKATPDMFYPDENDIDQMTIDWINNYAEKSHDPHVTLGFADPPSFDTPIHFTVTSLALSHFGKYGTCRKILVQTHKET